MLKITLDSNCIIYLFDSSAKTPISIEELSQIIKYGFTRDIDIAITTRAEIDLERDKDEQRKGEMMRKLSMFPTIGSVIRWDVSKWDKGDFYIDEKQQALWDELQRIIFPGLKKDDKRYNNKVSDIDHLVGHLINRRDIFITDDVGLIKKSDTLKNTVGLVVMNPLDALKYIETDIAKKKDKDIKPEYPNEKYHSPALSGRVTFDYSNNNHRYTIGNGHFAFETRWSSASGEAIHAYADSSSVDTIALAIDVKNITDISDASIYDTSSGVRTADEDEIIILKNINGCYAAIKILDVKYRGRGSDTKDELTFEYVILSDKSSDFTKLTKV